MTRNSYSRKIAHGAAALALLVAGGFALATPASASTQNCMMLENPPVSLTQELSTDEQSAINARITQCQEAQAQQVDQQFAKSTDNDTSKPVSTVLY
ncbi:hypothetical protein PSQ90_04375 [Devosia rhodophyticola]|uniref:Secreted protein n=1 Tax=Devosia rhodophyticola TaxID=3026423 RepID=A0ABY7Z0B8_9HYPH|nr:hypothetical protein [Devosia rhodophyticola]WDR06700.1 hypothetical protein PSQ90_04375 [Devosia rhodophyticola]